MRIGKLIFTGWLVLSSCGTQESAPFVDPTPAYADFMRGADLSFLPEIESEGTQFYSANGVAKDALTILKESGCNTVRIRLWHTPASIHSGLDEVTVLAARVKAAGMKVLLDIHYSDTWADPGHQAKPAAWQAATFDVLKDSVYLYTKKVLGIIQPDYVQIGNEINDGLLWESGRIAQLNNFIALIKQGCKAARDTVPATKIMIHFAGTDAAAWFFDQLKANTVDYDLMGISYYPLWHGLSLEVVKTTVNDLIAMNDKPLVIAETAYPFTLGYNDFTNNLLGNSSQLIPAYPATPEGQKNFLTALKSILSQNPKGAGFCYWGAEWVAFRGPTATNGSAGENMALFSFENRELPVMAAFAK